MLDIEVLLRPATSEPPSGPDLQYSSEYQSLERAAAGKPERQAGGTILPAEPPDWGAALEGATSLFAKSKDLRIGVLLARAALERQGFAGFASGAALLRGSVERFWETLYPRLERLEAQPDEKDAKDKVDATARVMAMLALTHRDMIQALRGAPLVVSPQWGNVTLRALDTAGSTRSTPPAKSTDGKAKAAATDGKGVSAAPAAPTMATLEAAFQQTKVDVLAQTAAALSRCSQEIRALAETWAERLPGEGPDFAELQNVLAQAEYAVKTRLGPRQAAAGEAAQPAGAPAFGQTPEAAPRSVTGEIRSREDVVRALDAICAYYAQTEPSSPLPLLLQRCRRLVTATFAEILKELLPESIPNLQKIAGKTDG